MKLRQTPIKPDPIGQKKGRLPMRKTAIISDSTCDLSKELIERYNILIIPLHVILGDQEYRDGENISAAQIYAWADANKTNPKTSAPAVPDAMAVLEEALSAYEDAVCFGLSEQFSASVKTMQLAVENLGVSDRVTVVDTQNLSTGGGLLVIEAAEMADRGITREEIVAEIRKLIPKVRSSFVVDTLMYLYRGGRCSGLSAMAGSALKLHPLISVAGGAMSAGKKYRGKINKVIPAYLEDTIPAILNARPARIFITQSEQDPEVLAAVKARLEGLNYFDEVLVTETGSVISCHCGPGTLGLLFISK